MLHGIADDAADVVGREAGGEAVGGALEEELAGIVRHGEVPPVVGGALDAGIDEPEGLASEVAAHGVARPEHFDFGIKLTAVGDEAAAGAGVGPQARVLRRADGQGRDVALGPHEVVGQAVEQCGLPLRIGALARDVVEEEGEVAHAEVIHQVELAHEVAVVFFVPLDVLARMDGPDEVDTRPLAGFDEFLDLGGFVGGIGLAPVGTAVVGVVFRAVEIGIHLETAVEVDEREARLVRPRRAVEAFDDAAVGQAGPVVDDAEGQAAALAARARKELAQGLQAVEGASLVVARDGDALLVDAQDVGARDSAHAGLAGCPPAEVDGQTDAPVARRQEARVGAEAAFLVFDAHAAADVEALRGREGHALGRGVDDEAAVVHALAGNGFDDLYFRTLRSQVDARVLCMERRGRPC